ncbi:pentapeptide repeat-containing protein [Flagellimonas sp. CMM7]|uniref:pentapeptide repeat-containing protein n=2 Tax=Flagellimonas sp. CMM7 TaxID=2654676 RepID=UPI0013D2FBFA|nr:pentapeptide repeat-containing protein [Flagellimonas sp. CMM7]
MQLNEEETEILRQLFNELVSLSGLTGAFQNLSRDDVLNLQAKVRQELKEEGILQSIADTQKTVEYHIGEGRQFYDYGNDLSNGVLPFSADKKLLNAVAYYVTRGEIKSWFEYKIAKGDKSISSPRSKPISFSDNVIISSYLNKLIDKSSIGFDEDEKIEFQEAFGKWYSSADYSVYQTIEANRVEDDHFYEDERLDINSEEKLKPIRNLLEDHFEATKKQNHQYSFTFLIADFGKGKSVLMNQLASSYAKTLVSSEYSLKRTFPIHINLRLASDCLSREAGLIETYCKRYENFKIEDLNDFESITFLLDSLDEMNPEISLTSIIKDILPVLELKGNINSTFRFLIASRPIPSLEHILKNSRLNHFQQLNLSPKVMDQTPMFIHVFGFKEDQIEKFYQGLGEQYFETYRKLIEKKILKLDEFRRPLLNYILFKAVQSGAISPNPAKISIYLSFINLLTIEAKYIGDPDIQNVRISKQQEMHSFRQQAIFRSILHGMAVLWSMNKSGLGTSAFNENKVQMNKACLEDILLAKDGSQGKKNMARVLVAYLSNSYFGLRGENFNFKHQSFAEILLAEYYIKVFLVFVFDKRDENTLGNYLSIGKPTKVSLTFYRELLNLLKKSIVENGDNSESIEARRLLSPLITSISIPEPNQLYSETLDSIWRTRKNLDHFERAVKYPPIEVLQDWPITQEIIDLIIQLCEKRINHGVMTSNDVVSKTSSRFNELVELRESLSSTMGQEHKWICLVTGNYLYNDVSKKRFFAAKINDKMAFKLIRMARFNSNNIRLWGNSLFIGMTIGSNDNETTYLSHFDFSNIDLSHTRFKDFDGHMIDFSGCKFQETTFEEFDVRSCDFTNAIFDNIKIVNRALNVASMYKTFYSGMNIHSSNQLHFYKPFPRLLCKLLAEEISEMDSTEFSEAIGKDDTHTYFTNLRGLWQWVFQNRTLTKKTFEQNYPPKSEDKEIQSQISSFIGDFYDEYSRGSQRIS